MKIIFLDIDGVLADDEWQGRDEMGLKFHPTCVNNLRFILDHFSDLVIVLSSSGRKSGLSEIKKLWVNRSLPGYILDVTPSFLGSRRGEEIRSWLQQAKSEGLVVDSFVVIDDNDDFDNYEDYSIRDRLIQTRGSEGLTRQNAKEAVVTLTVLG